MSRAHLILRSDTGADGRSAVMISVSHHQKRIRIGTLDRVDPSDWERRGPSALIAGKLTKVQALLDTLSFQGRLYNMDADELKKECELALGIDRRRVSRAGEFQKAAVAYIERLRAQKTKESYNYTLSVLERAERLKTLRFADITYRWLKDLESWMAKGGMKVNTVRIHMGNIRAIVNDAIRNGETETYGFRAYRIKHEETRKRALSAEDIRRLRDMRITDPVKGMYRDLWMLSFYLQGINAADLLTATPDQVRDGRLEFRRAKTGRLQSVLIQPEAQRILDRYKGGRLLLSCAEGYQHLDQFCRRWREGLRSLGTGSYQGKRGARPAAFPELTPYWCRHSWATQAHRCGVPLDIIARALGHSWSVVTDIYVLYDDTKADEANRLVIDSLNVKGC